MLIEDQASELRPMDDIWPVIREELANASLDAQMSVRSMVGAVQGLRSDVLKDLEAKYRKGDEEYNREWLNMSLADLEREVYQELLDLVVYHALVRARFKLVHE